MELSAVDLQPRPSRSGPNPNIYTGAEPGRCASAAFNKWVVSWPSSSWSGAYNAEGVQKTPSGGMLKLWYVFEKDPPLLLQQRKEKNVGHTRKEDNERKREDDWRAAASLLTKAAGAALAAQSLQIQYTGW